MIYGEDSHVILKLSVPGWLDVVMANLSQGPPFYIMNTTKEKIMEPSTIRIPVSKLEIKDRVLYNDEIHEVTLIHRSVTNTSVKYEIMLSYKIRVYCDEDYIFEVLDTFLFIN